MKFKFISWSDLQAAYDEKAITQLNNYNLANIIIFVGKVEAIHSTKSGA